MPETAEFNPATVTFGETIARSQALTVDGLGKGYAQAVTRQMVIADRKFDELDIEQSFANRYQLTGAPSGST